MSRHKPKHFTRRSAAFQLEGLEPRVLLAGDTFSSWQNTVEPSDVNQDGAVSAVDVLHIVEEIAANGSHVLTDRGAAEPGSSIVVPMYDTNGDGFVSPIDALKVVETINGNGEGELYRIRPEVTDTDGNVVTSVGVGDTFQLNVYVQDLRGADAAGIFSAYTDVTYDSGLVSVPAATSFVHGTEFDDGKSGTLSIPGLLDEVGGFNQGTAGLGVEQLLFQVSFTADAAGTVLFATDPADSLPIHEFLASDTPLDGVVLDSEIEFGTVQLTIGAVQTGPQDLVGFAQALDQAGVEFWSTRRFNTDAVMQRALFQDGQSSLPFNESLDSNGNLTTVATDANVTVVNTWIFPDDTQATGVLTLEELSTRSGVAIPTGTGPTLKQIVGSDQVDLELNSPLQLGLDAYDPANGPLTYTVTVDDSSLVEPMLITGNRSWQLDVEGYGTMVFEFFEGRASRATSQFITLTEDGFYDGITFHRVIDGFVIQGGDPTATGSGGSNLPDFDDQFNLDLQHNQVGILSMAKSSDDTNNSQFFVTDGTARHLDFNHTIFGQLIEGQEVLDAISAVSVGGSDKPIVDVTITEATVFEDQENVVLQLKALESTGTANVTVTATDGDGNQSSNTFAVDLVADSRNSQPFLLDISELSSSPGESVELQLEHVDIEGDDVFYFATVLTPSDATATVSETGLVTIDVPSTAVAEDVVTVRVEVSEFSTLFSTTPVDQQLVTVRVVQDLSAVDDAFTVDEDSGPHSFDVLGNDSGAGLSIDAVSSASEGGTVEISDDGLQVIYTSAPNFPLNSFGAQDETFTYTITDSSDDTSTATVTVTVDPVNDPPTANDDFYPADLVFPRDDAVLPMLREDELNESFFNVLINDLVSPDEELAQASAVESATATVRLASLNAWVGYVPGANVFGDDTFTYTFTDPGGLSDTATVTISLAQVVK